MCHYSALRPAPCIHASIEKPNPSHDRALVQKDTRFRGFFFFFFRFCLSGLLDSFPARSSEAAAGAIRNAPWFTFLSAAQFRPTYTLFLCYPYQVVLYLPAFPFVASITQIRYQDLLINHGKNLYFIPVVIYQTIPSSTGP